MKYKTEEENDVFLQERDDAGDKVREVRFGGGLNQTEGTGMKTAIAYYSKHHGNTKKLLDAIAAENDVTLIDVTQNPTADLTGLDRIGFASGIYYSSFAKPLLRSFPFAHVWLSPYGFSTICSFLQADSHLV